MDIQPPILFSNSNKYFPDAKILQSSIDFINPLDIDIYVKDSFGYMNNAIIITGGYIESFSKNHLVDERLICYKMEGLNHIPLLKSEGFIKINLIKQGFLSSGLIQGVIQGTPLLSLLILSLLTRILPSNIATVLNYISLIGLLITCLFFTRKVIKMFYAMVTSKEIDYNGIGIQYEKKTDMLNISDEYIAMLKNLHKKVKIEKIMYYQGCFYLKQPIKKTSIKEAIKNIFTKTSTTTEQETIQTINTTVGFILSSGFIGIDTPQ